MIKIDWTKFLLERHFLGFYGWIDVTAEPGNDFHIGWSILLLGSDSKAQTIIEERERVCLK